MPALRLEVFDTIIAKDGTPRPLVEASTLDEAKVASFEQGYSAGWEDAVAAQADEQSKIRSDLARNLQGLAFTFQDARNHVLQSIRPLILEMTNRLLPELSREALAPTVLEALTPLAETMSEAPVILVLNPAVRDRVESVVAQATGLPVRIEEETTLPEGQVYIRAGTAEAKVDLAETTAEIAAAVRAFFTLSK